jgi:hypothetical protein
MTYVEPTASSPPAGVSRTEVTAVRSASYQRLFRELLYAERQVVLELERSGRIDVEVLRRVVRDLDLEEARLG